MDLDPSKEALKAIELTRRVGRDIELSRDARDDVDIVLSEAAEELKYFSTADVLKTSHTLAVDEEIVFPAQGDNGERMFFSIPQGSLEVCVTRTSRGRAVNLTGKTTDNRAAYSIRRTSNGIWNFSYAAGNSDTEPAFNPTNLEVLHFITGVANMSDTKPGDAWRDKGYPAESDEMASIAIAELAEIAAVTTDREMIFLDPKVVNIVDYGPDGEITMSNPSELKRGISIHESNDVEEVMALFAEPMLIISTDPLHYAKRTVFASTKRRKGIHTKNVSAKLVMEGTPDRNALNELSQAENDELLRNALLKNIRDFVERKRSHTAA